MSAPHLQFSVRGMMIGVTCLGLSLGIGRELVVNFPYGGLGTIYSENYDETKFMSLRAGMTTPEVTAIMGEPLKKVQWKQYSTWEYSKQHNVVASFWRRWVEFQDGRVTTVINDYWDD